MNKMNKAVIQTCCVYVGIVCEAVVAVISLAPAIDTRPSSLCASILLSEVGVACVIAAGALFSKFSIVALLVVVLTAALAAF